MFGLKAAQRVIDAALQEIESMRAPLDLVQPMPRRHWGQDEKEVPMDRDF